MVNLPCFVLGFFRAAGVFAWLAPMNLCVCVWSCVWSVSARFIRGQWRLCYWLPGSPCPHSEVLLLQWNSQGLRPAPGPDQVGTGITHILIVPFCLTQWIILNLCSIESLGLLFDIASLEPQVSLARHPASSPNALSADTPFWYNTTCQACEEYTILILHANLAE